MSGALWNQVARRLAPSRAHRSPLALITPTDISPPLGAPRLLSETKLRYYELKARPLAPRLAREIATLSALYENPDTDDDWRADIFRGILKRAELLAVLGGRKAPSA